MKRWILIAATAAALSLVAAGCGSDSDGSMAGMGQNSDTTSTSSTSAAVFADADVTFAQGMIPHHEQAVEMAKLATAQASSQEVKDLAMAIESAQGPEIEQMTGWLKDWGQPVEMGDMGGMGMDGMMSAGRMRELEAASGPEFDALFVEMMIEHHQGAIAMAQTEVDEGTNPEAVALAKTIIKAQTAEIETMKSIQPDD